jgi:hypothetical protein
MKKIITFKTENYLKENGLSFPSKEDYYRDHTLFPLKELDSELYIYYNKRGYIGYINIDEQLFLIKNDWVSKKEDYIEVNKEKDSITHLNDFEKFRLNLAKEIILSNEFNFFGNLLDNSAKIGKAYQIVDELIKKGKIK